MEDRLGPPLAVVLDHLGPYHQARLRAAGRRGSLLAVELFGRTHEHGWERVPAADGYAQTVLFGERSADEVGSPALIRALERSLDGARPRAVAIHGWSVRGACAALRWCLRSGTPAVVMSESTAHDTVRPAWKEVVKRRIVSGFSAGLVGGRLHAEYLEALGLPASRIFTGYDAVDNEYFSRGAGAARRAETEWRARLRLPLRYFLAAARLVPSKNLAWLLEAYALYRRNVGAAAWDFVLLGDGVLRPALEQKRAALGITHQVHMPGFKQYDELPVYYGLAGAFVHVSTTEPWGLVVNEAAAAGLPVLVSRRCGCVPELVDEGHNGFTFDPTDGPALAALLRRLSEAPAVCQTMGRASAAIVHACSPDRFAAGLWSAAAAAADAPSRSRMAAAFCLATMAAYGLRRWADGRRGAAPRKDGRLCAE